MRRLSEYLPVELESMSDDDIDAIIDLECAYDGVPLLPPLPTEPEEPQYQKDVTVY